MKFKVTDTPSNIFEETLKVFLKEKSFDYFQIDDDGVFTFYDNQEPFTKEEFKVGTDTYQWIEKLEALYDKEFNNGF